MKPHEPQAQAANSNTDVVSPSKPTRIVMRAGEVFEGTPLEIVKAMQRMAMFQQHPTLDEYMAWVAKNARMFERVELAIEGATLDDRCASLVAAMLRAGLAGR